MIGRKLRTWRGAGSVPAALAILLLVAVAMPVAAKERNQPIRETTIAIRGMFCSSCAKAVEQALVRVAGVLEAKGDVSADRVRIRYDPNRVTVPKLVEAIRQAGYQARLPEEQPPHR